MTSERVKEFLEEMQRLGAASQPIKTATPERIRAAKRQVEAMTSIAMASVQDTMTSLQNGISIAIENLNSDLPPDLKVQFPSSATQFEIEFDIYRLIKKLDHLISQLPEEQSK